MEYHEISNLLNDSAVSKGPNDGTFQGLPCDVGHICFLNSTQKHIKLTLTGYARLKL